MFPSPCRISFRDADAGYTLSVGPGQPAAVAAAAAASGGMALPAAFEAAAAAGAGAGGSGGLLCIIREGEVAKMGGCGEQATLTLQVHNE